MSNLDDDKYDALPLLTRRMAWDIMPCSEVESMLPKLGLVPSSTDVADKEHEESHSRLDRCMPLEAPVEIYSAIASDIMTRALVSSAEVEIPQEFVSEIQKQNLMLVRGGVFAVLSQLFDSEQIAYGKDLKKQMGISDE